MTTTPLRGPAVLHLDLPMGTAQPRLWRWIVATVLAIGLSIAACAALAAIGTAAFPSTAGYEHFQFADYAKLTIIGVLGASIGWPVVTLLTTKARRLYLWAAIAVTIVSFAPDLWILRGGQPAAGVAVLAVMHVAVGVVTYLSMIVIAPQRKAEQSAAPVPQLDRI
jgi:ribulose kinase